MATVAQVLADIAAIQSAGRAALADKGVEVPADATLFELTQSIEDIPSGGTQYSSIDYDEATNTYTLAEKDDPTITHMLTCTYDAQGRINGMVYDDKPIAVTYNNDGTVTVGGTVVDVSEYPAPSVPVDYTNPYQWLDGVDGMKIGSTTTWEDKSGNGHNATIYQTLAWTDRALSSQETITTISGLKNSVDAGIIPPATPFSIATTFKFLSLSPAHTGDTSTIFGNWRQGSGLGLVINPNTHYLDIAFHNGSAYDRYVVDNAPATNKVYNVVLVYDGAAAKVYLNGNLLSTNTVTFNPSIVPLTLFAEKDIDGTPTIAQWSLSNIHSFRYYDRAITADDVATIAAYDAYYYGPFSTGNAQQT